MTIRTVAPKTYIPPRASDIKAMAKQVGVERYSKSLVEDLCNIQAGGDFAPNSEIEQKLVKDLTRELTRGDDGGFRFRGERLKDERRDYVRDKDVAHRLVTQQQIKYHESVQEFIRTLDFKNVPGYSPLEKSMGLLKLLSIQEGGCPKENSSEDDEMGNSLPIFTKDDDDAKDPVEMASRINDVMENIANMDEHEKILCDTTGGKSPLSLAEDMINSGKDIMLQIKRDLDKLCTFQTSKNPILKRDSNGAEIRYRSITDLSEYPSLHPMEHIYPEAYKQYRLMSGVSRVRERCSKINRKMLLYIICDCSASMDGERFLKAGGVVMNRLKAVLKGEADLWLAFFHRRLEEEFRATSENVSEVKQLMSKIKASNFNAGGTNITRCTVEAIKRIEKKRKINPKLIKPELVVITDGDDDTSGLKVSDLKGVRLNSIIVGGHNQDLINVARLSGGVGISRI